MTGAERAHIPGFSGFVPAWKGAYGTTVARTSKGKVVPKPPAATTAGDFHAEEPKRDPVSTYAIDGEGLMPSRQAIEPLYKRDPVPGVDHNDPQPASDRHVPGYCGHVVARSENVGTTFGESTRGRFRAGEDRPTSAGTFHNMTSLGPFARSTEPQAKHYTGLPGHQQATPPVEQEAHEQARNASLRESQRIRRKKLDNQLSPSSHVIGFAGHVRGWKEAVGTNWGAYTDGMHTAGARDTTTALNFSKESLGDLARPTGVVVNRYTAADASVGAVVEQAEAEAAVRKAGNLSQRAPFVSQGHGTPPGVAEISSSQVPGYGGHVPAARDSLGATYGKATRAAYRPAHDRSLSASFHSKGALGSNARSTEPISKIKFEGGRGVAAPDPEPDASLGAASRPATTETSRTSHVAGYGGHVSGWKDAVGTSYGTHTRDRCETGGRATLSATTYAAEIKPAPKPAVRYVADFDRSVGAGGAPHAGGRAARGGRGASNHVPGYGGHCPELREKLGITFGAATAEQYHAPPAESTANQFFTKEALGAYARSTEPLNVRRYHVNDAPMGEPAKVPASPVRLEPIRFPVDE